MNKQQLIDLVADKTGSSKASVDAVLTAITEAISTSLANGNEVTLHGLGKFKVAQRKARSGRNPRTGEAINIPASVAVSFSVAKQLKDTVNG